MQSSTFGRLIAMPSYQELLAKADLVTIAEPETTKDLNEKTTILGAPVLGIQTTFRVSLVMKGDVDGKTFQLHHYKFDRKQMEKDSPEKAMFYSINPATLVAFGRDGEDGVHEEYLMFLKREKDNTFVPLAGQTDIFLSVRRLTHPPMHWQLSMERNSDAMACRFRLEITAENPDKVFTSLIDEIHKIAGVTEVGGSGSGRNVSLVVHVGGRDPKDDEDVLKRVLRRLEGTKKVRVVVSDFLHRRAGEGHEGSNNKNDE